MIEKLVRPELKDFIPYNANQRPYAVKLDANESPFDLSDSVKGKLIEWLKGDTRLYLYPDDGNTALREALAALWNTDPACVIAGAGSDQLIQMAAQTFVGSGDKVICPVPSFSEYEIFTKIASGMILDFPLDESSGFGYDCDAVINLANREKAKLLFLCTPNNPSGSVVSVDDILRVAKSCPDTVVVADEAYAEFASDTVVPHAGEYENLIVLRTFSKAWGLAGVRCGYSISSRAMAAQLAKTKPSFNLSSIAQYIAMLVLDEKDIAAQRIRCIKEERGYLAGELSGIGGIKVFPSEANFILIKLGNSDIVHSKLAGQGIMVRAFSSIPALSGCLRVSVGSREQNDAFLAVLKDVLPQVAK